ncbi:hypothetical protein BZA77DRAFT_325350 [Pyronema omphalodes]|nr:hypothetical protein BZA77DRAFT_325350 [Pyronema omphalodes]
MYKYAAIEPPFHSRPRHPPPTHSTSESCTNSNSRNTMATSLALPDEGFAKLLAIQMEELATAGNHSDPDWLFAKTLMEIEVQQQLQVWQDHAFAQSMQRAAALDGQLIEEELQREKQLQEDRALAQQTQQRLDQGDEVVIAGPATKRQRTAPPMDPEVEATYNKFVADVSPVCWKDRGKGEGTSGDAEALQTMNMRRVVDCNVCQEPKDDFEVVKLACEHNHCLECLKANFRHSIQVGLHLPRCCDDIPIAHAAEVLNDTELSAFQGLLAMQTATRRIICSNAKCATTILPQWKKGDIALCLACNRQTCTLCHEAAHEGECPEDPDTQSFLEVAERMKYQRCYSCGYMCDLKQGCYHITCRCSAEFCYICGSKWKTCKCIHFEEQALRGQGPSTSRLFLNRRPENYSVQRDQLANEIRAQARQHEHNQRIQLQALKIFRAERAEERELAAAHQEIRRQEDKEKERYFREQEAIRRNNWVQRDRILRMRMVVSQRLTACVENRGSGSRSKGKQKATVENFDPLLDLIMEYMVLIESQPPKPKKRPAKTRVEKQKSQASNKECENRVPVGTLRLVGMLMKGRGSNKL